MQAVVSWELPAHSAWCSPMTALKPASLHVGIQRQDIDVTATSTNKIVNRLGGGRV